MVELSSGYISMLSIYLKLALQTRPQPHLTTTHRINLRDPVLTRKPEIPCIIQFHEIHEQTNIHARLPKHDCSIRPTNRRKKPDTQNRTRQTFRK